MKLEFHPEAELKLIEAAEYYEVLVPGLGERFESEVRRAIDLLLDHPQIGAPADPDLRKLDLNRFSSTLYYSVTSDVLRIEGTVLSEPRLGRFASLRRRTQYFRWVDWTWSEAVTAPNPLGYSADSSLRY
jgi:plasmid stabilization system protein ParE